MAQWCLAVDIVNLKGVMVPLGRLVPHRLGGELGGDRRRASLACTSRR